MHKTSGFILPLAIISLASLQGCSTAEQRAEVESIKPVAVKQAPVEAGATASAASPAQVDISNLPAPVDRYTVMPGDTLGGIAARQEVYGDARLWPLLYRANISQIGPGGLIYPKQVLIVDRSHRQEDVKALTVRPKTASAPAAVSAKPAGEPQPVATASAASPVATSAPAAPPAAQAPPVVAPAAATTSMPAAPPPTAQAPQSTPATASKPATTPTGQAPQGAPSASAKPSDYLYGARRAFAAGDTPRAIYYYSVYLGQKNNDVSAWGELGNVHYFDGNLPEAAKAYFNAANLLIDRGQTARAIELIPVIDEGDPSLSAALHQRLTTIKR
jgi:LysM repeat protein